MLLFKHVTAYVLAQSDFIRTLSLLLFFCYSFFLLFFPLSIYLILFIYLFFQIQCVLRVTCIHVSVHCKGVNDHDRQCCLSIYRFIWSVSCVYMNQKSYYILFFTVSIHQKEKKSCVFFMFWFDFFSCSAQKVTEGRGSNSPTDAMSIHQTNSFCSYSDNDCKF